MLKIPLSQLAYIIEKAREFDAATAPVDIDSGSTDDTEFAILEATADNSSAEELTGALDALNDDQRVEILALMWLGRGDFDRGEWPDCLVLARQLHSASETEYLIGTPLLADYLEEGLAVLGYSLDE
jgi:hypothetical protein